MIFLFIGLIIGDKENVGTVIGIDLGTTFSCVGVYKDGQVEIIANEVGNRITPSFVSFGEEGRLVGDAAKNQGSKDPTNTVFDIKRLIGRNFNDKEVQNDMKMWPFKVLNKDNRPIVQVEVKGEKREFYPEEISAMVLQKMKEIAETYLGYPVKSAVITVPAYFNDAQRKATMDAGTIAGLNVLRVINEPTAAAIAYGLNKKEESKVLIFDLGGGTFDVSLLEINEGLFQVLATSGDTHLGGEDFNRRILEFYIKNLKKKGINIDKDHRAKQRLLNAIEQAKRTLSSRTQAKIEVESLVNDYDFSETLTRAKFEQLNMDLFKSTLDPVKKVLEQSGIQKHEIDDIVLVGGSSRIPKIQELLIGFFNGKRPSKGIHPDEAVSYGAAVQAGVLSDDVHDVLLVDITPLTLGIETVGGVMTKLIPLGTIIPTTKSQIFTTTQNNQDNVKISVYEGERSMVKDNNNLGEFILSGIPPSKRGVPQIEVTFEISENGILTVRAEDKGTGNQNQITIENPEGRLSDEEIKRMVDEALKFEEEDKRLRDIVNSRNELQSISYDARNLVDDDEKVLSDEQKQQVKTECNEVESWLDSNIDATKEEIDSRRKSFEEVVMPILALIQQAQQETPPIHDDL